VPNARFAFRIHQGLCFRSPHALLLYQRNGAVISMEEGQHLVERSQLELWSREQEQSEPPNEIALNPSGTVGPQLAGRAFKPESISVVFPELPLRAPYLKPGASPSMADVESGTAFQDLEVAGRFVAEDGDDGEPGIVLQCAIKCNVLLKLGALKLGGLIPDKQTGCYPFSILAEPCSRLEKYLRDPSNSCMAEAGHQLLILQRDDKGQPLSWLSGYNTYNLTAARFKGDSQMRRTRYAAEKGDLQALLHLPGWKEVLRLVASRLGWTYERLSLPHHVHILCQDEDLQAGFTWHTDGESIGIAKDDEIRLLGLSIQLSNSAASAMWVHGFNPQVYAGQGGCVLFHGGSLHRTLPWVTRSAGRGARNKVECCAARNIIKVVFFYRDIQC